MNQENNQFNTNNLNEQNNNGIFNNQPLQNNQSFNNTFNQQPINLEPQPTPNYQQPTTQTNMPQHAQQPMNTLESDNSNNHNFNSNPPKKKNIGLIVGIITIIVLIIILIIVGPKFILNDRKSNNNVEQNGNTVNNSSQNNNVENESILNGGTYKVPGKNIYVDVPNWQKMNKGFTELFILHGIKYVAVTSDVNSNVSTLDEAHSKAFEYFKQSIQNYSYVNYLNISNEKYDNINGIKVYRFEGTLNCGHDTIYDAYVIGYSFIMNDIPCSIIGSVIDKNQEKEMINEMTQLVDAMMKTIRTER